MSNLDHSRHSRGPGVSGSPQERTFDRSHNRLAAADKKSKVIIVAVMRKMITTFNAMLRDETESRMSQQQGCSFAHLVGAGLASPNLSHGVEGGHGVGVAQMGAALGQQS